MVLSGEYRVWFMSEMLTLAAEGRMNSEGPKGDSHHSSESQSPDGSFLWAGVRLEGRILGTVFSSKFKHEDSNCHAENLAFHRLPLGVEP